MQMKEKKTSVFEIESIPKAVAVLAIPSVLSMLVTVLYNMVDTVFVGQTHDPYQMNAVSMATPVFMILMAFGNLFGIFLICYFIMWFAVPAARSARQKLEMNGEKITAQSIGEVTAATATACGRELDPAAGGCRCVRQHRQYFQGYFRRRL